MTARSTARLLGYSGLVPFVALAFLSVTGNTAVIANPKALLLFYAAIITSFMGGVIWGRRVLAGEKEAIALVVAIVGSLLAFLSLIVGGDIGLELCALTLVGLFVYDWRSDMADWFRTLRLHLTIGAVTACLVPVLLS